MDMINFFLPPDGECSSSSKSKFYLYDDGDATPVYLKEAEIRRNCTPVLNESGNDIILRPVDHALYPESGWKVHCDAFLHDRERSRLCFVEMKCVRASWMAEAYEQLLQTILDFRNSHPAVANAARVRRAYAANSRHPNFQFSQADVMRRFRCVTGFLLRFENCVSMG